MMLRIVSLHKSYGDHEVLRSVSLRVDAGQIVAIAGPNGAGIIRIGNIDVLQNSLGARREF
ncbi:MAG TPA: hypothetical protein QF800_06100 [Phycisphaerales bacterium]|nr:hypothetical protein [Phycisphaerales bacterium]